MFWLVASVEWYWKVVWPGTFAGWTDFIQYLVLLALWDDDGVRLQLSASGPVWGLGV